METLRARALAMAAHRYGGGGLARCGDELAEDARAAAALVAAWRGSPIAVARTRGELVAPRPRHWRRIDASWIDHALGGEGAAVRAAVAGDRDDPVARWLARWFLGDLVAMPGDAREAGDGPAALAVLDAQPLVRALAILGRRQLAHALGATPPHELTAIAARFPWGKELAADVVAIAALGDAAARLGSQRGAVIRTRGLPWSDPLALPRAGLRAIAPACAAPAAGDAARQIAQRLPRPIAMVALAELRGPFAHTPADVVRADEIAHAIARAAASR